LPARCDVKEGSSLCVCFQGEEEKKKGRSRSCVGGGDRRRVSRFAGRKRGEGVPTIGGHHRKEGSGKPKLTKSRCLFASQKWKNGNGSIGQEGKGHLRRLIRVRGNAGKERNGPVRSDLLLCRKRRGLRTRSRKSDLTKGRQRLREEVGRSPGRGEVRHH